MKAPDKPLAIAEFVTLLAMMVSILALSIDAMLPALDQIGRDLSVAEANDVQLVISSMFLGFAAGQLVAGPLSDSYGRKPVIYGGYVIFVAGCLMAMLPPASRCCWQAACCRGWALRRRASYRWHWSETAMRAGRWPASSPS
jgi:MFS family permease